ncbi:hypothetical protein T492DRAFT_487613 [Pavlovales sp. CCMP2436]|nr:hypothetical protein T492DRAFT_487613 [Pavlovales sp. CCMP2436]
MAAEHEIATARRGVPPPAPPPLELARACAAALAVGELARRAPAATATAAAAPPLDAALSARAASALCALVEHPHAPLAIAAASGLGYLGSKGALSLEEGDANGDEAAAGATAAPAVEPAKPMKVDAAAAPAAAAMEVDPAPAPPAAAAAAAPPTVEEALRTRTKREVVLLLVGKATVVEGSAAALSEACLGALGALLGGEPHGTWRNLALSLLAGLASVDSLELQVKEESQS